MSTISSSLRSFQNLPISSRIKAIFTQQPQRPLSPTSCPPSSPLRLLHYILLSLLRHSILEGIETCAPSVYLARSNLRLPISLRKLMQSLKNCTGCSLSLGSSFPVAHWPISSLWSAITFLLRAALLTVPKPLTVWITINCGKFWKTWEYQTTWPASWETYMQVRKQQLELDMEQQTGSK